MISELTWDSRLFNRKIGELKIVSESSLQIEAAIRKAKTDGFKYIICRIQSPQTMLINKLSSLGFYISDIGVIWAGKIDKLLYGISKNSIEGKFIKEATNKDLPTLIGMVKSLFIDSRFYSDPFFSELEADNLYQTWIKNSVKNRIADVVFFIPNKGLVTCKKSTSNIGEIVLIGVKNEYRGKGIGTNLMQEALKWFKKQNVNLMSVRTQLKNVDAMNFYAKLGFYIQGHDILFAQIL
ncbi:MAG: hypothetical protein BA866_07150 [Desulfobulbaceae bacterium S5133MH15]|nr:MAG: hypothetical protein BA866_07150 [Desulfobulbaceae bacterium S5133MH15]OEU84358.1 MAG: hypothetical protein BA873_17100 [Desulfobulbaceae bacterium C00003063]